MDEGTTLLFDLPGCSTYPGSGGEVSGRRGWSAPRCCHDPDVGHACPGCGVFAQAKPYDVRESRIKDLPFGHRPLSVTWRKRR